MFPDTTAGEMDFIYIHQGCYTTLEKAYDCHFAYKITEIYMIWIGGLVLNWHNPDIVVFSAADYDNVLFAKWVIDGQNIPTDIKIVPTISKFQKLSS